MADTPSPLSLGPLSPAATFNERWPDQELYERSIGAWDTAAKKVKTIAEHFEARRPKEEAETERAIGGVERAVARPRPAIPSQERVPSPPKPEDYHRMSMGYLGAMVLLGAFGGKFIRNAANAPLAAFNGALNGWQEGNLEAYKEKTEEWKQKQQQVLDNNRARLDEYRTILEDRNASIQDQMLRVKLTAAKHQDKMMYDRADAENWTGVGQAYDQSVAVHERAVAATDKLVEQLTRQNETSVERANQLQQQLPTPEGQQWLHSLTPGQRVQVEGFVRTYADPAPAAPAQLPAPGPAGGSMPTEPPPGTPMADATATPPTARMPGDLRGPVPPGMKPADLAARQFRIESYKQGKGEPSSSDWANFYRQQHPGRSAPALALQQYIEEGEVAGTPRSGAEIAQFAAHYAAQVSAGRTVGTRLANIEVSAEEFRNLLPQAEATSAAVPRGKFLPFNKLALNVRLLRSDPAYAEFVAANRGLITAYGATMSRSGANTVAAQAHAEEVINIATSHEAYKRVLDRLLKEVEAVEASPTQAMAVIDRIGIGGGTPAPAGAGRAPVRVSTPEEAAKLPPGTPYVNPQGDHFTR